MRVPSNGVIAVGIEIVSRGRKVGQRVRRSTGLSRTGINSASHVGGSQRKVEGKELDENTDDATNVDYSRLSAHPCTISESAVENWNLGTRSDDESRGICEAVRSALHASRETQRP